MKKVTVFLDEDELPLSERQKAMILKDPFGISQKSSKASNATIPGKPSSTRNLFISNSHFYESILSTQPFPSPSHNTLPTPILIPQPRPTNITSIELVIVYETRQHQQQQIPQTPPPPQLLLLPIPPPSKNISAPQQTNPNTTSKKSPSRDFANQESEGTSGGIFNFELEHIAFDSYAGQHLDAPSLIVPRIYCPYPNPNIDVFLSDTPANPNIKNLMLVRF